MVSITYGIFEQAMRERRPVHCAYHGKPRELCPTILGWTDGEEKALVFQTGGGSEKGLAPRGAPRCLTLSEVADARLGDGAWRQEYGHSRSQTCVKDVDLDINPDSPYNPRRRLDDLR